MIPPRTMQSDYMHFAKFGAAARYNLASSGVLDCALSDMGLSWDDLALHGPNAGGYPPLMDRIADRFGVPRQTVVTPGGGCSFANHLAFAALLSPGDEVLVEAPTYELIVSTLGYLQARVSRFTRSPQAQWRLDPAEVSEAITPKTRLIVLTNLHNPSSALADDETILAIAAAAEKVGAMVLVDEVYRELMFRTGAPQTVFKPDRNIVVTSSLTKAYGLSGLRCGWILAPEVLAERMRRLNDLYGVHPPHVAERMSVAAFDRLGAFRSRANDLIDQNRATYIEILGRHPALEQTVFQQGTTVFPRLLTRTGDDLFQTLATQYDTSVVPGRFFDCPDHIRVGLGGDPHQTREGLERLAAALSA